MKKVAEKIKEKKKSKKELEKESKLEEEIEEDETEEEDFSKTHIDKKRFAEILKLERNGNERGERVVNLEGDLSLVARGNLNDNSERRERQVSYQSYSASEKTEQKYEIEDPTEKERRKIMGMDVRMQNIRPDDIYLPNTQNQFFPDVKHEKRGTFAQEFQGINANLGKEFNLDYESKDRQLKRKNNPFSDYDPFGANSGAHED
ncbi:MAG: hypothetical protein Q7S56_01335 [Nanoarchaeota archaeon]|nr:hypothetical protein [Nanoarchaeota archaeon]